MTWGAIWAEDDYRELLRSGSVKRELDEPDHDEWRKGIRDRARADRMKVRTVAFAPPHPLVWAGLVDWQITDEEMRKALRKLDAFRASQRGG